MRGRGKEGEGYGVRPLAELPRREWLAEHPALPEGGSSSTRRERWPKGIALPTGESCTQGRECIPKGIALSRGGFVRRSRLRRERR